MNSKLNRLNKYTKAEIIDGLCHQIRAEYIIDSILVYLDEKQSKELFEAAETANKAEAAARREYAEWLNEMAMKYGSGKHVNIADLSLEELGHGAALENKIREATMKMQNISRKLNKMIGVNNR